MRTERRTCPVPLICAFFVAFSLLANTAPTHGQSRQVVNLELVLLIDVSASVSNEEFLLQIGGLAAAFTSPAVLNAIKKSGGIAVCVIQWAQQAYQYKSVDWKHLHSDIDGLKFAAQIVSIPRQTPSGQTAIGNALMFALNELDINSFTGLRRVIDLSGDGRSNDGRLLKPARAAVIEHNVTINGLAILNEVSDLKEYFRSQLIGGPGAFVITARDYTDFSRAIREKLEREIRPAPLADNTKPDVGRNANFNTYAGMAPQPEPGTAQ